MELLQNEKNFYEKKGTGIRYEAKKKAGWWGWWWAIIAKLVSLRRWQESVRQIT